MAELIPAVKTVVFAPLEHADNIREAMGKAGAGKIGNYMFCSFSSVGTGRFLPMDGAHPAVGRVGKMEEVQEERIETVCEKSILNDVLKAINAAHPYEEPAIDIYPIEILSGK